VQPKKQNFLLVYEIIAAILFMMLFSSCDILKKSTKEKEDVSIKDNIETKTFRKGDSVSFRPGNIMFKDTTIYRVSKENTVLRTVYDNNGNIRDIDCYASRIEELTKRNFELEQSRKDKQKEKEEKFDSSFILYIVGGLVVLGIVALFLFYKTINKNSKAIDAILNKIG
jgi:hypothetical protein